MPLKHAATRDGGIPKSELRDVDIIIAEASAAGLEYSQDPRYWRDVLVQHKNLPAS